MSARARGFTLIEVLVALAVVAIALAALARTGAGSLDLQDRIERRTLAGWVAANVLAEARLADALSAGRSRGRVTLGGMDWTWQRRIEPAPGASLWRVEVDVLADGERLAASETGFIERR